MKYLLDTANLDKIRELCQHAFAAYSGDGMMGDCITPYFNRILGSCFLQMLDENEISRQEIRNICRNI